MKDVVKESILSGRVDMCHRLVPITLRAALESQFLPESSPTLALVSPPTTGQQSSLTASVGVINILGDYLLVCLFFFFLASSPILDVPGYRWKTPKSGPLTVFIKVYCHTAVPIAVWIVCSFSYAITTELSR